jgi:alanine racemase
MAQHHVQVLVSRANFFKNIHYLRRLVAPSKLCVVMKANAYEHGLEALAPVAVEAGADMLGICTNPEAETVRRIGLKVPLPRLRMALEAEMEESVRELDIQEQVGSRRQRPTCRLLECGVAGPSTSIWISIREREEADSSRSRSRPSARR